MSDTRKAWRLWNPVQAYQEIQAAWAFAKALLLAGHGLVLELRAETRSDAQNRLLHALIADVARQAQWQGKKRTPAAWKVLFVSGHSVATGQGAEMVPGLEGEFCNLRESTARMSKARLSSLVEYVHAWCAHNDIKLREARQWMVDEETGEIHA